jgi:Zn-dependent protease with chaperone function
MTNEQFDALVARLEAKARRDPSGYKLRVFLLALLGNAYLGMMLLLIVGLLLGLLASVTVLKAIAVKLIIVVGFFLWLILKALWVRFDAPEGTEIKPRQAGELFAMIDGLRRQLGAPRFHHVLITDELNAGVVQSPRLGIFGWPRNYLLIGLPLMKALSVEQFKAVLAHEFGHLAKGHGRLSNWIYSQRLRWSRLMAALEANDSNGSFLFKPFLNWFAPYFSAYSFPLARANEYEADATSARLTSPVAAAQALTGLDVIASYLGERYWPQIHRQADEQAQPGFMPYRDMGHRVASELDAESTRGWLERALEGETTSADTHPALSDRLKAIGEAPDFAPPPAGQAADTLLGEALGELTEAFDRRWRDRILPAWEERHRKVQEDRSRLADLNERHAVGSELSLQEAYDRATLTESTGNDADGALEQLRALHARAPDDAVVCLELGARLLARDDDSGRALVEHAPEIDENATLQACELLRNYHWRHGRKDEADVWHQRLLERAAAEEAAGQERNTLLLADKFDRHELPAETVEQLRAELRAIPGLRKAYFVRKRVKLFAHRPCYVLGFSVTGLFRLHSKKRVSEALQRIHEGVKFPGETLIINVDGDNYRFGRKFFWMRGARVV